MSRGGFRRIILFIGYVLICNFILTSCTSKAAKAVEKVELGQKYLTELNYTEAIASFTEAINLDPENIPAYMGRAQAYRGTEQYAEAKADYTTVIEKTTEQPYTQATAYVGRAEVSELIHEDQDALTDYQAASNVLETVKVEKLTDVTEQMLEALKIKVYEACARLSASFGRHEAAVVSYTNALYSLEKLPDDTAVMDVPAEKIVVYTELLSLEIELEWYTSALESYDALMELGVDKTDEQKAVLAAVSLSKSWKEDLKAAQAWLEENNYAEFEQEICLDTMLELMQSIMDIVENKKSYGYDDIKAILETENAQQAMRNLLARGYQLRFYGKFGQMLAIYAGETAWADVHEDRVKPVTKADVEQAVVAPGKETLDAISLENLYVYYGPHEDLSREGKGYWFVLNPEQNSWAVTYDQWEQDARVDIGSSAASIQTVSKSWAGTVFKGSYAVQYRIADNIIIATEHNERLENDGIWTCWTFESIFYLSQPILAVENIWGSSCFVIPEGTRVLHDSQYTQYSIGTNGQQQNYRQEYYQEDRFYGNNGLFPEELKKSDGELSYSWAGVGSYDICFRAE